MDLQFSIQNLKPHLQKSTLRKLLKQNLVSKDRILLHKAKEILKNTSSQWLSTQNTIRNEFTNLKVNCYLASHLQPKIVLLVKRKQWVSLEEDKKSKLKKDPPQQLFTTELHFRQSRRGRNLLEKIREIMFSIKLIKSKAHLSNKLVKANWTSIKI